MHFSADFPLVFLYDCDVSAGSLFGPRLIAFTEEKSQFFTQVHWNLCASARLIEMHNICALGISCSLVLGFRTLARPRLNDALSAFQSLRGIDREVRTNCLFVCAVPPCMCILGFGRASRQRLFTHTLQFLQSI